MMVPLVIVVVDVDVTAVAVVAVFGGIALNRPCPELF